MRLSILGALALTCNTALGYLDTSPFFLYSTSSEFHLQSSTQVARSASIVKDVYNLLTHCPSEFYIIVSQPGVSSSDYNQHTTPYLSRNFGGRNSNSNDEIKSSMAMTEILGSISTQSWKRVIAENCGDSSDEAVLDIDASTGVIPSSVTTSKLINVNFPAITSKKDLKTHDTFLQSVIDLLPAQDYTVIYTTTPKDKKMVGGQTTTDLAHQELKKRDLSGYASNKTSSNQTMIDGPLFDKYQFFSPGIFMGFSVLFILLSIMYVGLYGLSSLQVTYAAFDKESGQLAASGKKNQ